MTNLPNRNSFFLLGNQNTWDINTYTYAEKTFGEIFHAHAQAMQRVTQFAQEVYRGVREVSPFIECITREVCPSCKDVCCINKHGFYNFEDLIYLHALGLKPLPPDFMKKETDPCQFLSPTGCIMERSVRPSGCNWYFCDSLFDSMETRSEYQAFDEAFGRIAELWMKMASEFRNAGILLAG